MYSNRERIKLWACPFAKTAWNKVGHLTQSISLPGHLCNLALKKDKLSLLESFSKMFCIFLFSESRKGRAKERERNISWLPLVCLQMGTQPTTQACALTGNQTHNLLACRPVLSPLSHTSQGWIFLSLKLSNIYCQLSVGIRAGIPSRPVHENLLKFTLLKIQLSRPHQSFWFGRY